MIKTLNAVGNSHALIIDKCILQVLDITPKTPIRIRLTGDGNIILIPQREFKKVKTPKGLWRFNHETKQLEEEKE